MSRIYISDVPESNDSQPVDVIIFTKLVQHSLKESAILCTFWGKKYNKE